MGWDPESSCKTNSVKLGVRFYEIGEVINHHASMFGFSMVMIYFFVL